MNEIKEPPALPSLSNESQLTPRLQQGLKDLGRNASVSPELILAIANAIAFRLIKERPFLVPNFQGEINRLCEATKITPEESKNLRGFIVVGVINRALSTSEIRRQIYECANTPMEALGIAQSIVHLLINEAFDSGQHLQDPLGPLDEFLVG